eukprot:4651697-Prymnesium_polylepis.1
MPIIAARPLLRSACVERGTTIAREISLAREYISWLKCRAEEGGKRGDAGNTRAGLRCGLRRGESQAETRNIIGSSNSGGWDSLAPKR